MAAATLLPLIRADEWWIRWFDFPRLQIWVLGILLVCLRLLGGWRTSWFDAVLLIALVLAVGYQAYRIFPYTRLSGVQVEDAPRDDKGVVLRIVTANVLKHNRQAEKYLQVIADANPDIILTTEADQWWAEQLEALDHAYAYHVKHPMDNTYGMIIHSKFPLVEPSVQFLVEPSVPSIHSGIQLPGDQVVNFIGLHPRPPRPDQDTTERDAELIVVAERVQQMRLPVLVLGDLNDVAWSHTTTLFQEISGLLDPRIGRGMFNTFHTAYFFIRFPLDHIFHSTHFKIVHMRRLPHIGSDHFPFYAALSFTPEKDSNRQPAPTPAEKREAENIREKAF